MKNDNVEILSFTVQIEDYFYNKFSGPHHLKFEKSFLITPMS